MGVFDCLMGVFDCPLWVSLTVLLQQFGVASLQAGYHQGDWEMFQVAIRGYPKSTFTLQDGT